MGSGELTATMVEVHKAGLNRLGPGAKAVFLDTPAGFQLNVDQISHKASEYFQKHISRPLSVASFKSRDTASAFEAEHVFHTLKEADYILIGPGSPTYAVRQWQATPIPDILVQKVRQGGCLVAASAAALTVGRFALPVYEIYKVGEELRWAEGINVLEPFGFNLVVIPHWNNAEGGSHDTRFCFMGAERFERLASMLPADVGILGLDEHTACVIDLERGEVRVRGIGNVVLRTAAGLKIFGKKDSFPVRLLQGAEASHEWRPQESGPVEKVDFSGDGAFWDRVHGLEDVFRRGLDRKAPGEAVSALLELDRTIWQSQQDMENEEFISQAREILRDLIVLLGMALEHAPMDRLTCVGPLVDELLALRTHLRQERAWNAADAVREHLQRAGVIVEDTPDGVKWRLQSEKETV
jgi:cyanophycinase-like exopeptidase